MRLQRNCEPIVYSNGPVFRSADDGLYQHVYKNIKVIDTTVSRYRPRFFDQVGHDTMYASSENKHFFTKSCHRQTYQNYEQGRQKLGTILENNVS